MNGWPAVLGASAVLLMVLALREARSSEAEGGREPFGRGGTHWSRSDGAVPVGEGGNRTGRVGRRPRLAGAAVGIALGALPSGLAPGRIGPLVLVAAGTAGFLSPDLIRSRLERSRHRRIIAALPDALDLLAVSVATGRGLAGSLADLAASGRGPLVDELATVGEDIAWGSGQAVALDGLRHRVGGPEISAFCATLERSRRLGSPLAEQLRRQSSLLRQDQRRSIEEEAARAAPKIQLVIALILVPSVLLLIVAALIANVDSLLPTTAI